MRILRLTLKKKWFDMIYSGVKKQEYREIKEYWTRRFIANQDEIGCENFEPAFNHYDAIEFVNGYGRNAPRFTIECVGLSSGHGNTDWGAEPSKIYFVFNLGKIL